MKVDPVARPMLEVGKRNPIYLLPIEESRTNMIRSITAGTTLEEVRSTEDLQIPSLHAPIPIRVYRPETVVDRKALIYLHGGGWCLNSIETHEPICRTLANSLSRIVISVDYRLAPEHKYPAGLEDCIEAVQWIFDNAAHLGLDPAHIAVGGDSSGANFAAVLCQYFRDRGGVRLEKQMLIYPSTDYFLPGTRSLVENDPYSIVDRNFIIWAFNNYLEAPVDLKDPYIFPLQAARFDGLPEAIVITADCDPLRDEGLLYAEKMEEAGVNVVYRNYEGMMHGFFLKTNVFRQAREALAEVVQFMK